MLEAKIVKLRNLGLTYDEIAQELDCSKGTICYHLGTGQKTKAGIRRRKNRAKLHPFIRKIETFTNLVRSGTKKIATVKLDQLLTWKIKKFHMKNKELAVKDGKKYSYESPSFTLEELKTKLGTNPKCYLTGKEIDIYDTKSYEFDHITPRSRGGQNTLDNLGICTKQANRAKSNMTPEEFVAFCKSVLEHNGYKVK